MKRKRKRNYSREAERSRIYFDQETRTVQDLLTLVNLGCIQKEMVIGRQNEQLTAMVSSINLSKYLS